MNLSFRKTLIFHQIEILIFFIIMMMIMSISSWVSYVLMIVHCLLFNNLNAWSYSLLLLKLFVSKLDICYLTNIVLITSKIFVIIHSVIVLLDVIPSGIWGIIACIWKKGREIERLRNKLKCLFSFRALLFSTLLLSCSFTPFW